MDPIELLMSQYGMSRAEAEQIHLNLSQSGTPGGTISRRTSLGPKFRGSVSAAPPEPTVAPYRAGHAKADGGYSTGPASPADGSLRPGGIRPMGDRVATPPRPAQAQPAPQVPQTSGELGDPFEQPADIRYKVGEGKSGYSNDEMVRQLVTKYQVSPEAAVNLAGQIRAGKMDDEYGVQQDADYAVQQREQRRQQLMKRYSDILHAAQNGEQVSDAEREWAGKVGRRIMELKQAKVQATARDAQAATETDAFNQQMARDEATDIEAGKQKRLQDERDYERGKAEANASMARATQQQRLSDRARSLSLSFGLDPASAMQLALQLEGVQ